MFKTFIKRLINSLVYGKFCFVKFKFKIYLFTYVDSTMISMDREDQIYAREHSVDTFTVSNCCL